MDQLVADAGTAVLAEIPETYGAEHILAERAINSKVSEKYMGFIRWWEDYTTRLGGEINNNPSPGNKAGGLTTIFEKSLGAVAQGQIAVLAHRGITRETVGVPVKVTMDTVSLGDSDCGIPLFVDRLVHEVDGYILINRIKPHINFTGPTESGILKMAAMGIRLE